MRDRVKDILGTPYLSTQKRNRATRAAVRAAGGSAVPEPDPELGHGTVEFEVPQNSLRRMWRRWWHGSAVQGDMQAGGR